MSFIKNGKGTSLGVVKIAQPVAPPRDDQDQKAQPKAQPK